MNVKGGKLNLSGNVVYYKFILIAGALHLKCCSEWKGVTCNYSTW